MTRTAITPTMKLQRNPKPVAVDMDGETVMMDIDMGSYFALTGSGSFIWATLEQPVTLAEIVAAVRAEFDVSDDDNADEAIATFVGDLFAGGLVQAAE